MARFEWKAESTAVPRPRKKRWTPEGPQNIHIEYQDGKVHHVALTEEVWAQFVADKTVKHMWAHPQAECLTPTEMDRKSDGEASRDRAPCPEA